MSTSTISLREQVRDAVQRAWPAFAEEHPRLSRVLDTEMILSGATEVVSEDAEYLEAMAAAQAAESIAEIVHRVVGRWLRTLV
jgi:hypothetical protein